MTRTEATSFILKARQQTHQSYAQLAAAVGRHLVWTTSAILGQQRMSEDEALRLCQALSLGPEVASALQSDPVKAPMDDAVRADPLIYRMSEIVQVYGVTLKALIEEEFGDGIMSAIDFQLDMRREPNPAGDRVVITMNGKFLPYKKW